jgi:DNA-binding GntR family transcriptional regulator
MLGDMDALQLQVASPFCILHAGCRTLDGTLFRVNAPSGRAEIKIWAGLCAWNHHSSEPMIDRSAGCPMRRISASLATVETVSPSSIAENLAALPVERPDRVADQVYRHLRRAILSEAIKPGARLRETEVAAALKVSRTPVREAISRLIGDWLVHPINTGGVEVIDATEEIAEIYYIREALEICAGRMAATRMTPEQLGKLDALAKAARQASFDERVRLNQEFHLTIAEASGSKRLLAMIRGLREYFLNPRWVSRRESKLFKRAVDDHKKIVAALRARSPERVERALRSHLKIGWDELMSSAHPRRD